MNHTLFNLSNYKVYRSSKFNTKVSNLKDLNIIITKYKSLSFFFFKKIMSINPKSMYKDFDIWHMNSPHMDAIKWVSELKRMLHNAYVIVLFRRFYTFIH